VEIPLIGFAVSHSRIFERLGGGTDVVYKRQDPGLGRPVALEFLPPDFTRDPETKLPSSACLLIPFNTLPTPSCSVSSAQPEKPSICSISW
jgi:hypothetical protein